ncbi:flavin-containing monooxygenase [Streptomyces sp. NBC_01304]|uniref:flavin-containing monooxygenase n=1 Tax=Streptomyces sp. NBC_01304 TaxID=2903818 RepID=UPI002E111B72|nr:NAD(P)/FAD-dependent oxidoreductase [Streptomyces sp. NBC_01304]
MPDAAAEHTADAPPEHVDVLIVGAGLSGIGAACHLRRRTPGKSFAILEGRESIGGTWDLFRYPGVRSDSDMFTLGYSFRPWSGDKAIVDGPDIRAYIQDTARAYGIDRSIRFGHRVRHAEWSSDDARWTVTAERTDTGEQVTLTCAFLLTCSGYYRYDEGYTPEFPGIDAFEGQVVHPQHWPEDLDCTGKRVVVIGSGATAMTLVPALARQAEHVTMVQRSPSYVLALPSRDVLAKPLRRLLPKKTAGDAMRWKNALLAVASFRFSRRAPKAMRGILQKAAARRLPRGYDVKTHFGPAYDPWDQRLCIVPDGDLFREIKRGRATVATDHIATFTPSGLRLASGTDIPADVVVTATGLNLLALGGMTLTVDGRAVDLAKTVAYKGMMVSDVPNFAMVIGYTNASWTLKADLVAQYVCRLLTHMDTHGYAMCTPQPPGTDDGLRPLIDLRSGYVLRSLDALPKQGPTAPWRLYQSYPRDVRMLRRGPLEDQGMRFTRAASPPRHMGRDDTAA